MTFRKIYPKNEMQRIELNSQKKPSSSSSTRCRSRGWNLSKKSSVENEGIDSMKQIFRIRRSSRKIESSEEESFDEEDVKRRKRSRISQTKSKVYDEVIGVPIPRRIRSGLKGRAKDLDTANQPTNASYGASEDVAPLSKGEAEVAEVLIGLTMLPSPHLDGATDTFQSSSVPDLLAFPIDPKRRKSRHLHTDDIEIPSTMIAFNSKSHGVTSEVDAPSSVSAVSSIERQVDNAFITEMIVSSPKFEKQAPMRASLSESPIPILVLGEEKLSHNTPTLSDLITSPNCHEQPNSNASCNVTNNQSDQLVEQESNQSGKNLTPLSSQIDKFVSQESTSLDSYVKDCMRKVKLEIDLMALPPECEVDATDNCRPQVPDFIQGSVNDKTIGKSATIGPSSNKDIGDQKPKQRYSVFNFEPVSCMKGAGTEGQDEHPLIDGKTGAYKGERKKENMEAKQDSEKIMKDIACRSESTGPSSIFMPCNPVLCWLGGTQPSGFPAADLASRYVVPSLQGATPVEGNTSMQHAPLVMLPPKRSSNCASHCFIARFIQFQQQIVRLNPKPHSMSSLLQPCESLLGRPNVVTNGSSGSGSVLYPNSPYVVANHADSFEDNKRRNHLPRQQSHQGGVFLFPSNQINFPIAGANFGNLSEYRGLVPTPCAFSTTSELTNTNCSNLAAIPDPQYSTILRGNYPLPNKSTYQPCNPSHGPSISSQLHAQALQLNKKSTVSTGSSAQKSLDLRPLLYPPKSSSEALNKPEYSRIGEAPDSQRKNPELLLANREVLSSYE